MNKDGEKRSDKFTFCSLALFVVVMTFLLFMMAGEAVTEKKDLNAKYVVQYNGKTYYTNNVSIEDGTLVFVTTKGDQFVVKTGYSLTHR